VEKYCAYVAAYQRGRAEQERRKADALPQDWDAFVVGLVSLYVEFVYDVIEHGRRRAIAEMLAACKTGSGQGLRRRILEYLEQGEFSEAVEEVLSDSRAGLGKIVGVLAGLVSPNDAAQLRGQVARQLETYPDHPGLLMLRTATEALARDGDPRTIQENYEAFLVNAVDAYGMDVEEIAAATGTVLKFVGRANRSSARVIEQLFVLKFRDRESLKGLIAQAGIGVLHLSPWVLLDRDTQPVERFIR